MEVAILVPRALHNYSKKTYPVNLCIVFQCHPKHHWSIMQDPLLELKKYSTTSGKIKIHTMN